MPPFQLEKTSAWLWKVVFFIGDCLADMRLKRRCRVSVHFLTCQPKQERGDAFWKIRMYARLWIAATDFF